MKIINKLFSGSVELVFDTYKHQYTYNNEIIPGVTQVLSVLSKPALIFWAANCASDYFKSQITPGVSLDEVEIDKIWQMAKKAHTQKKTDSANLGSMVHKFVEQYIKGENPPVPINLEMKGACQRFLDWVSQHNVTFLSSEQQVFSLKHKYAGTVDFVCKIDGKLWLGDLKTSSAIYDEYYAQAVSYLYARQEEFKNENYNGIVIVRVGKEDGDFEASTRTLKQLTPYYDLFLNCLATYRSLKVIEGAKNV